MSKVLIFGGTGHVGGAISEALVNSGHQLIVSVHKNKDVPIGAEALEIDINNLLDSIENLRNENIETIIYSIGLIKQIPGKGILFSNAHDKWVESTISLAKEIGVKRFILVSANGTEHVQTIYDKTKRAGEQKLENSDLDWTILRPSIVLGMSKHPYFGEILDLVTKFRISPVIGSGKYRFTPVDRKDLGQGIAKILDEKKSFRKILPIGGSEEITLKEMTAAFAKQKKRAFLPIHIPLFLMKFALKLKPDFINLPIDSDLLQMLIRENIVTSQEFWRLTKINPKGFSQIIKAY